MSAEHAKATPQACYSRIVAALAKNPGVTVPALEGAERNRFGSNALKVNGKIFAMLVRGEFVVKIPRARVDALVAAGEGRRFDPGHGRVMREWLVIERLSEKAWMALATEALEFVGS